MLGFHDTIWIEPSDRERLAAAGLDSVDALLRCVGDQIVAWSRSTDTVRIDLPAAAGGGSIYLKRYHHLLWRRRIKGMLRGTFFGRSRARAEFERLQMLRDGGAPVVRPVAFGERRTARFLRTSLLITDGVGDAESLTTYAQARVSGHACERERGERRSAAEAFGRRIRAMHEAGHVHGALYWRNVLVRHGDSDRDFEFALLDVPGRARMAQWGLRADRTRDRTNDLVSLAATGLELTGATDMMRFFRAYRDVRRLDRQSKELAREILARAEPLRAHERYRLKMNERFHYHLVPTDPVFACDDARTAAVAGSRRDG